MQKYSIKTHKEDKLKMYFLSDFHLGSPNEKESKEREKKVVQFLDSIKKDITHLFLVGDIFDFWFEYKYLIPKGWIRLLGKLAELNDNGVQIFYFHGNHDMWFRDYFEKELGIQFFKNETIFLVGDKKIMVGHGDEIENKSLFYLVIKYLYRNEFMKFLFRILPPSLCIYLALKVSQGSKEKNKIKDAIYLGEDKEFQIVFAKKYLQKEAIDYFVFGHRHYPNSIMINKSKFINLGDWVTHFTYAYYDGKKMELKKNDN